jgi:hypothetical protein
LSTLKQTSAALALALAFGAGGAFGQSPRNLSIDEARSVALDALRAGQPETALQIAGALLQRDAADPFAHYLRAFALYRAGQTAPARAAAAQAAQVAQTDMQRWQIARLQALIAASDNRLTTSELWLRRADDLAPGPQQRLETRAAFRAIQARNPLSFSISASLTPSNNVNGGAATALSFVDGVEGQWVGQIRYEGRALSGVLGTLDLGAGYRLRKSETQETRLSARLNLRHAVLSEAARLQWAADNAFYESVARPDLVRPFPGSVTAARLELGLTHAWRVTDQRAWRLEGRAAVNWPMFGAVTTSLHLGAEHRWALAQGSSLTLGVGAGLTSAGAQSVHAHAVWDRQLGNGDRLSLMASLGHVAAGDHTTSYGLGLGYALARPVGPFRISADLGLTHGRTPDAFEPLTPLPDGRRVNGYSLQVNAAVPGVSVMGFSPEITLRHGQTTSNVSRFGSQDTSIGLRLRSTF